MICLLTEVTLPYRPGVSNPSPGGASVQQNLAPTSFNTLELEDLEVSFIKAGTKTCRTVALKELVLAPLILTLE